MSLALNNPKQYQNAIVIDAGSDSIADAYNWLKSSARDKEMGSLSSTNKRTLILSGGVYILRSKLSLISHIDIVGLGDVVIYLANASNCIMMANDDAVNGNSNIGLYNFRLVGNKANNSTSGGISFSKVTDSILDRVQIANCTGNATTITSSCARLNINNCSFTDCEYGLYIVKSSYITVRNIYSCNNFDKGVAASGDGLVIGDTTSGGSSYVDILGGNISSNGKNGIHCYNSTKITFSDVTIESNAAIGLNITDAANKVSINNSKLLSNNNYNLFVGTASTHISVIGGEIASSVTKSGAWLSASTHIVFSGVKVHDNYESGIGAASASHNVKIIDCTVYSNCTNAAATDLSGVYLENSNQMTVSGNTIYLNGRTDVGGNDRGGICFYDCSNVICTNNQIFDNAGFGITCRKVGAGLTNVIIGGNICFDSANANQTTDIKLYNDNDIVKGLVINNIASTIVAGKAGVTYDNNL